MALFVVELRGCSRTGGKWRTCLKRKHGTGSATTKPHETPDKKVRGVLSCTFRSQCENRQKVKMFEFRTPG